MPQHLGQMPQWHLGHLPQMPLAGAFGANAPAKNHKFGLLNIIFYKFCPKN
jgi:hypothetical protein